MIWMEQYTDKRLRELQQDVIRNRWHTIELEVGCDFPIIRCPLVLRRRVMPYEHNGSFDFVVGHFCGSVILRQSF